MKRTLGAMHQNNRFSQIIDFLRKNSLAREQDSKPVITRKGEQFLHELESAGQPISDLSGAI
jgi:predicted transcriptional regulator